MWPFRTLWDEERQAVRDYLKREYLKNHPGYVDQDLSQDNVREEARRILNVCIIRSTLNNFFSCNLLISISGGGKSNTLAATNWI